MKGYRLWIPVVVTLLSFSLIGGLVYYNAIHNPFQYDDAHHITMNPSIRDLSGLSSLFSDPSTFSNERLERGSPYRPLLMLTYALNYRLSGLNPAGYHIVNLVFHVGAAFLVFLIVQAILTPAYFAALSAGILFLVHPFNSEIVNYISTRSSVMSGFFYLSAFYCWVRFRGEKSASPLTSIFYLASLLAFAAGMLSKESAVTLPAVLWLYDLYFFRGRDSAFRSLLDWRTCIPYIPFVLIVVIPYLYIWGFAFSGVPSSFKRGPGTQFFTELPALVKYLQMFIIPAPLTIVHDMEVYRTFLAIPVLFSAVVLAVYTAAALFLARSSSHPWRVVSFFMFWFYIVLLPTTVVPLNLIFQEHRGYLAVITMTVFAGVVLERWKSSVSQTTAVLLLIALCTAYSAVTVTRNAEWKDELTLWTDAVKKSPGSSIAYTGLGIVYKNREMYDQAIETLNRGLAIHDGQEQVTARHNLAQIYTVQGKLDLAVMELEGILKNSSGNPQIYNDLGIIYYNQNRPGLAEDVFLRAIKLRSNDYLPYFNLGVLYTKQGRVEEAIHAYEKAVALNPWNTEIRFRLGILLEQTGEKERAVKYFREVVQMEKGKNTLLAREAQEHLQRTGR